MESGGAEICRKQGMVISLMIISVLLVKVSSLTTFDDKCFLLQTFPPLIWEVPGT